MALTSTHLSAGALAALVTLASACAPGPDDDRDAEGPLAGASATSTSAEVDVTRGPCTPLLERLLSTGAVSDLREGVRVLETLDDVNEMIRSRDVVWPNHPSFVDVAAPSMRIATVSLVTGEVSLFDLSTEATAPSADESTRVLARDEASGQVRIGRRVWQAQALLGGLLGRKPDVAPERASFHIRGRSDASTQPASLDQVDACFDGSQGLLVDDSGVPRLSLSPPVILRMWAASFRNPGFAPPVWPDEWTRPGAPGTRHLVAKFQIRGEGGNMTDSSANSDYTIHEVPPTVCYETGDARACGTTEAIAARPALLRAANDGDPSTDPAALAPGWLNWSGGCINLHPDLGGGDSPDFRAFDAKTEEARRERRPVYAVLSYPGLDQERLLKHASVTNRPGLGDALAGHNTPSWYGALR